MPGQPLTEEEIERRLPVWVALSELFLDTELQPEDFDRIADTIVRAGIPLPEVERILEKEVAPVFIANALAVTGEWAGWPKDFVKNRILGYLGASAAQRALAELRVIANRRLCRGGWDQVAIRLKKIGQGK